MRLTRLQIFLVQDLRRLYAAELLAEPALGRLHTAANAEPLKVFLHDCIQESKGNAHRLESVFRSLGESPRGVRADSMRELLEEAEDGLAGGGDPQVLDAVILAGVRRVIAWKTGSYEVNRAMSERLRLTEVLPMLQVCLDAEASAAETLQRLFHTLEIEGGRESKK